MAEKSVLTHVEEILTCAMCLEILDKPRTLTCLHSYCLECLIKLKTENNGVEGYNCPQCRRFTASTNARTIHLVVQLLDAYRAANKIKEGINCDSCKEKPAKWKCLNCAHNTNLCDMCKSSHDKYMRNANHEHQVLSLDDYTDANRVLDSPVYCVNHKDHKLEVYCTQCEQAVCVLCTVLHHKDHTHIAVAEALASTLTEMENVLTELENLVSGQQQDLKELENQFEENKKGLDEENEKLDKALEADIAKLKLQHQTRAKVVEEKRQKAIQELENIKADKQRKINEETQLIHWVKATRAKTTGISLLLEIKGNLISKVRSTLQNDQSKRYNMTRCFPWRLDVNDQWQLDYNYEIPNIESYACTRLSIVWRKLSVVNHNTGDFLTYNLDGTAAESFIFPPRIKTPRVVVQINDTKAVLAAASGLYLINRNAEILQVIDQDDFSDVCVKYENANGHTMIIGLEWKRGQVKNYISGDQLKLAKTVQLDNYEQENIFHTENCCNTFVIYGDGIYVAMILRNCIVKYDHTGKKLEQHKQSEDFRLPSICGIDSKSAVMVTYSNYKWNGILENCQFKSFKNVYAPWYFVLEDANTMWALGKRGDLYKYIIHE